MTTSTQEQVGRAHAAFHPLRVADVEQLTADAVAVTFAVPPELRADYAFAPGQHLTLRAVVDGEEVRRSYSICSAPSSWCRARAVAPSRPTATAARSLARSPTPVSMPRRAWSS